MHRRAKRIAGILALATMALVGWLPAAWPFLRGAEYGTDGSAEREYLRLMESRERVGEDGGEALEGLVGPRARASVLIGLAWPMRQTLGFGAWSDPRLVEAKGALRETDGFVERAIEVSALEWRSLPKESADPTSFRLPLRHRAGPPAKGSDAIHVLLCHLRASAEAGDWVRFRDLRNATEGLIRLMTDTPGFYSCTMRALWEGWLLQETRWLALEGKLTGGALEMMHAFVSSGSIGVEEEMWDVEGERLVLLDDLNGFYTSRGFLLQDERRRLLGREDPETWAGRAAVWIARPWVEMTSEGRESAERAVGMWSARWGVWLTRAPAERGPGPSIPERVIEHLVVGALIGAREGDGPTPTEEVAAEMRTRRDARAATGVALRLVAYRERHGSWPSELREAMREPETICPSTGRAWVYRVGEDGGISLRARERGEEEKGLDYGAARPALDEAMVEMLRSMLESMREHEATREEGDVRGGGGG